MPPFFHILSEYFWLLCLGIGAYHYAKARQAALARVDGRSEEAERYLRLFSIGSNTAWLVMGVGQISGSTPTIWYYFRPQDGNPFVIAWIAYVLLTACIYAWWVIFAGGAEKVRDLNLLSLVSTRRMTKPRSLKFIKLTAIASVIMMPVWVWGVVLMNVPIPK